MPDLTGVERASGSPFDFCVETVNREIPADQAVVLVAHSGSGVLLPSIASRLCTSPAKRIFVDAGLPPATGQMQLAPGEFRAFLDERVEADGMLSRWSNWWDEEAMEAMVPDSDKRALVRADIPRLPLRYYDQVVEVPPSWTQIPAGYLLLSDSYRGTADQARSRGWPVIELPGEHLHLVVDPSA